MRPSLAKLVLVYTVSLAVCAGYKEDFTLLLQSIADDLHGGARQRVYGTALSLDFDEYDLTTRWKLQMGSWRLALGLQALQRNVRPEP